MKTKTKVILISITALLLVLIGFFLGRQNAPEKIVEKEKVVEKIVYKEKVEEKRETDTKVNEDKDIHEEKTIEIKPDGTKIIKVVTDTKTKTDTVIKEKEYIDRIVEKEVEKLVVKEKIIENKNDWIVSAKLGTNFNQLSPSLIAPYFSPIMVGVDVNRRIIGDVYVGAWGLTDTNLKNIQAGIQLTIQF